MLRILLLSSIAASLIAETPTPEKEVPKPPAKPKVSTHEVKPEPFVVEVKVKGIFEAQNMHPVNLVPKAWGLLIVTKAAPHGAAVKKDDVIVSMDTRGLEDSIRDIEGSAQLAELNHRMARHQFAFSEKMSELTKQSAERQSRIAVEDAEQFEQVHREWREKSVKNNVKWMEDRLAYELEELKQLEQMYEKDDLTEETEEIILKRQRDYIERLKFSIASAKVNRDKTLEYEIPRNAESFSQAKLQADLESEKLRILYPLQREQARLDMAKREYARKKAVTRLEKLKDDLKLMTVRAPADGYLYYGPCVRGGWPMQAAMEGKLKPGGKLAPHEIFATIVSKGAMQIRAEIAETHIQALRPGTTGSATLTASPKAKVQVKIEQTEPVSRGGKFNATLSFDAAPGWITAGMRCQIRFVTHQNPTALAIPEKTLHREKLDPDKTFVYLPKGEGFEKRSVKAGEKAGNKIEILSGLKSGDKVLLKDPTAVEAK
jgi:HlyD family secretion protein